MNDLPRYVDEARLHGRKGFAGLEWKGREIFAQAPFTGVHALELGAGDGLLSLWTLYRGARSVVSLEPEAAGATHGVAVQAARHRAALGLNGEWDYRGETLQDYRPDRPFGLVFAHNSINHLDEPACERLHEDPAARASYRKIFDKIAALMAPEGRLVFADCARANLWGLLGKRSPWAPEIEWHKHQEPETWCGLLVEAGLQPLSIRWVHPFYRAQRTLGPLLRNRMAARCLASWFVVTARKPATGGNLSAG